MKLGFINNILKLINSLNSLNILHFIKTHPDTNLDCLGQAQECINQ